MKTAAIYFSLSGTQQKHALAPFTLSKAGIQHVKFIKRITNLLVRNKNVVSKDVEQLFLLKILNVNAT